MLNSQATDKGDVYSSPTQVLDSVKEYYGKVLATSKDLKTSACTACGAPPAYLRGALRNVPDAVMEKFYGCGNPIPSGIDGRAVLDLGCGSGRDCYVAAQLVGATGKVTGIDMTDEQLATARGALGDFASKCPASTKDIRFLTGFIEDIRGAGVPDSSIDVAISNCVVNLSPNKPAVLKGVYDALKVGGEFYFSDVYADRRLPEPVRRHELLFGECIAGAMYTGDFVALCKQIGFADPRVLSTAPIKVNDPELRRVLGAANFYSITYRLFKLPLEPDCEDYGQIAWYKGTIPAFPLNYTLDKGHVFETDRPVLVCGNSAAMLQDSWLGAHFRVQGDRTTHFGKFDCSQGGACGESSDSSVATCGPSSSGGCC